MVAQKLQYKWIAGIVMCPQGWLIVPARVVNATVIIEDPMVVRSLIDVVDFRPKFDAVAINVPLGYPDTPNGPDGCFEDQARDLVGWPRRVGVRTVPSRAALNAATRAEALEIEPWLTRDDFRRFRWLREASQMFQPFHQRAFFSANAELSYTLLNDNRPLKTSPFHQEGIIERMRLIRDKLPGADEIISRIPPEGAAQFHVMQATGLLWTARRAVGRAINRVPMDPDWDSNGLRVELVR